MNNFQLKQEYSKRNILLRCIGGKNPKYRISSYDYLPRYPVMTIFSKDALLDVDNISKEYHNWANERFESNSV